MNPEGYETFVGVKPHILLESERKSLQGLGVQKTPVNVSIKGTSSSEEVVVRFNVSRGSIEPEEVKLTYNEPAVVFLRSEGLGESIVSTSAKYTSNTVSIPFVFPWLFIGMALLGGLIGGVAKHLFSDQGSDLSKKLLYGLLIGLMSCVVYYVLGLNLLHLEMSKAFNEFAILGFSFLSSYFGIRLFSKD